MDVQRIVFNLGGEDIAIETGRVGKQANGSVWATMGGTTVFCAATASKKPSEYDYFPLQVQYSEKFYAAGRIPGGFLKREGRPKDREVLVSRLIDRPMRPLFPEGFMNEVQVVPMTLSVDNCNPPDVLAMIAAGASVSVSDIPFDGPVGSCRVGLIDGTYLVNPTMEQMEKSVIDLVVAGTEDAILMVEGHASNITEEQFLTAMEKAHEAIGKIVRAIRELVEKAGKPKMPFTPILPDPELVSQVREFSYARLQQASANPDKLARLDAIAALAAETVEHFRAAGRSDEELKKIGGIIHDIEKDIVRLEIIEHEKRPDGRRLDEIRPITIEVSVLPRAHGSSLFTRGQTQALVVSTLGTVVDAQRLDDLEGFSQKRFMLHYNFPPFSVGEVGRMGGVGRREIGHGMLAERSLSYVMPDEAAFPYTVRIVSDIMESNGSSSMASVCGGCLSLMDAGVPIKAMVAGVAMGLVMLKEDGRYKVLSDIQGVEDHLGDMDFKVAGTREGITAFQMDIKVKGISFEIFRDAIARARESRLFILDRMTEVIDKPRAEISPYAPKIVTIKIDSEKIGLVIGKGGETIRGIQDETGAIINIADDGTVTIASPDKEAADKALAIIQGMTCDVEVGTVYNGKVRKITDFGAFIEILPGKDGLCHISKLADTRVNRVSDIVQEGEYLRVKVIEVDKLGRINLSAVNVD